MQVTDFVQISADECETASGAIDLPSGKTLRANNKMSLARMFYYRKEES